MVLPRCKIPTHCLKTWTCLKHCTNDFIILVSVLKTLPHNQAKCRKWIVEWQNSPGNLPLKIGLSQDNSGCWYKLFVGRTLWLYTVTLENWFVCRRIISNFGINYNYVSTMWWTKIVWFRFYMNAKFELELFWEN